MALTVYNMPGALTAPIIISVIPAITAHLTQQKRCPGPGHRESAARVTSSLPCPAP